MESQMIEKNDNSGNSCLHISILQNDLLQTCEILKTKINLLHLSNPISGDQPAHIAARLGNLEIIKMLIEYNVDLNRRNFNGLTPLGEAKMNSQKGVIKIIQTLFVKDRGGTLVRRCFYPHLRKYNKVEDEYLIRLREKERCQKYNRFIKEKKNATIIQTKVRMNQARRIFLCKQQHKESATIIQKFYHNFKWNIRYQQLKKRRRSSILIQSIQRQRSSYHFYHEFLKERLQHHRQFRTLSCLGQCLWRGYKSRQYFRYLSAKHSLPDPNLQRNFQYWRNIVMRANPPKRKFGIFLEYTLGGTPTNWNERHISHNGHFRDVKFYVHSITNKVQWNIPSDWTAQDKKEFEEREEIRKLGFTVKEDKVAKLLQAHWRGKKEREKLRFITKAYSFAMQAEKKYFKHPNEIKEICNYALYLHAIKHEYQNARPLYSRMNQYMMERGIDNAFVLYSYALFCAINEEEDWTIITNYAYRAHCAHANQNKSKKTRMRSFHTNHHMYDLAETGFFRQAAYRQNMTPEQKGQSWCNYALCRMIVYRDWDSATDCFKKAIHESPYDKKIVKLFEILLHNESYMGLDQLAFGVFEVFAGI